MKTLDIVIIGFNESKTLEKCIVSSLKAKKYTEEKRDIRVKMLYVDDYSTDNSVEIAQEYFFQTIYPPQGYNSPSNSRNIGLYFSSSDYIMYLDADMELNTKILVLGTDFLNNSLLVIAKAINLSKGNFTLIFS